MHVHFRQRQRPPCCTLMMHIKKLLCLCFVLVCFIFQEGRDGGDGMWREQPKCQMHNT